MIQVKECTGYYTPDNKYVNVESEVNEFIKNTEGIEVINILYSTTFDSINDDLITTVLIIYKEEE